MHSPIFKKEPYIHSPKTEISTLIHLGFETKSLEHGRTPGFRVQGSGFSQDIVLLEGDWGQEGNYFRSGSNA